MNKRDAKLKSVTGELTIGELRAMINAARERGGMSKVNPQFTMLQVCDIYTGALGGRDDAEKPAGMRTYPCSRAGRQLPTRDSMIIKNILRDCAP